MLNSPHGNFRIYASIIFLPKYERLLIQASILPFTNSCKIYNIQHFFPSGRSFFRTMGENVMNYLGYGDEEYVDEYCFSDCGTGRFEISNIFTYVKVSE